MTEPLPLRDIHLPDAVSLWPPAPGWWLLLLAAIATVGLLYLLRRHYRGAMLRRQSQREIARILSQSAQPDEALVMLQRLSIALRRIGMSYGSREGNAGLLGQPWFDCLNQLAPSSPLSQNTIHVLRDAPYQASIDIDASSLDRVVSEVRAWAAALPRASSVISVEADHV